MLGKYFLLASLASIAAARRIDYDWNFCWGRGEIKSCTAKPSRTITREPPSIPWQTAADRLVPAPSNTLNARDPERFPGDITFDELPLLNPVHPEPLRTLTLTWIYTEPTLLSHPDPIGLPTSPNDQSPVTPGAPPQAARKLKARQKTSETDNHRPPNLAAKDVDFHDFHESSTHSLDDNRFPPKGDRAAEKLDTRSVPGSPRGEMFFPSPRIPYQPENKRPKPSLTSPPTLPHIGPDFWPNWVWQTKTLPKHPVTSSSTLTSSTPKVTSASF
ncbi:MAG: hypothetical protein LQ351_002249 [Letrouitia transgressa]|nr:MAG: hypothetical protein LQ351_002249 [Letrouitia transgressa]